MFPRRKRLPRASFPEALASGRRLSSPHFTIVLPKRAAGYAVVVSKKNDRRSVARHLLKRRVLAALRRVPLPPSLIVFPKSSAAHLSAADIRGELDTLLSKIRH